MKILYLIPPSEGKNTWWKLWKEEVNFDFSKPLELAINATEKDLKCKWLRYQQGIDLNKNIENSKKLKAISRYSGVMYNAIDYDHMSNKWKKYFEDNFKILSGMYGIVSPLDIIGNYKLPIETKWLYTFWWEQITDSLNALELDYIVDMLPLSYAKMINWKNIQTKIVRINFLHLKDGELKKISHGVKKIKWAYIKDICENNSQKWEDFLWKKVQISENEYDVQVIFE